MDLHSFGRLDPDPDRIQEHGNRPQYTNKPGFLPFKKSEKDPDPHGSTRVGYGSGSAVR